MKRWQIVVLALGAAAALAAAIWAITGWLSSLWFNYAWPSDKGNGPEAIQQTVVYALAAAVLYPPIRRAIEGFARRHVDEIKRHATAEYDKVHEHLNVNKALLHHVIIHSDMPNHVDGLAAEHQPKEPEPT